jgi:hypothetical protein
VYSVTEIPESHWDWSLYYNSDPLAKDKIVSKWGGFLPDVTIDPFRYGISPAAMKVIEPLQLLLLETVRHALDDAGYDRRPFARARTAAVCGIGGGGSPMATMYGFRACMPMVNSVPGMAALSEEILSTCESIQFWRAELCRGCGLCFVVGSRPIVHPRAAGRHERRGFGHGSRHGSDAVCLHGL